MFFFPSLIKGIEQELQHEGYQLLVMQSNNSLEREKQNVQICSDNLVDGLLISLSAESTETAHLNAIRDQGIPVVVFDKSSPDAPFDQILLDDYQAAFKSVEYLLAKGSRKICGVFGDTDLAITKQRLLGYQEAHAKAGIDSSLAPTLFASSAFEARKACQVLLKTYRPDAFFFMSDEVASGLIPALAEADIKVPSDCLMVGISDGYLPYLHVPTLSFYHHSGFALGIAAAKRLLYRIHQNIDSSDIQTSILQGSLVVHQDETSLAEK
jgi:LacI family transcriptional regulator